MANLTRRDGGSFRSSAIVPILRPSGLKTFAPTIVRLERKEVLCAMGELLVSKAPMPTRKTTRTNCHDTWFWRRFATRPKLQDLSGAAHDFRWTGKVANFVDVVQEHRDSKSAGRRFESYITHQAFQ
jgi:hypothetical protein